MSDGETAAIRRYHESTKHSVESLRATPGGLDWANQPIPFKLFTDLEPIPLPAVLDPGSVSALSALALLGSPGGCRSEVLPTVETLAQVLHYSAGITKVRRHPGGATYFRAPATTGALYHVDLYIVTGELAGLSAGVYHFDPSQFSLRRLREGDHRAVLIEATAAERAVASAPLVLVAASTYWRNAWKYRARAWRHVFWDGGTMSANLLAIAAARDLPRRLVIGFVDAEVGLLLGLDPSREGALGLFALGHTLEPAPVGEPMSPLKLSTEPLSAQEVDYPEIRAAHSASSFENPDEVADWRAHRSQIPSTPPMAAEQLPLQPQPSSEWPDEPLERVISRRGSTRQFDPVRPLPYKALSTALALATLPVPFDFTDGQSLIDVFLIVHAVDGLAPGAYRLHRREQSLELLSKGNFRSQAGRLGLFQELPSDAAVNVYCLADIDEALSRLGSRGYRAAQLEGAIIGGRLYLASYALGFGATGLTFLDDEVIDFFAPHATGRDVMFLTALGFAHPSLLSRRRRGAAVQ